MSPMDGAESHAIFLPTPADFSPFDGFGGKHADAARSVGQKEESAIVRHHCPFAILSRTGGTRRPSAKLRTNGMHVAKFVTGLKERKAL